MQVFVLAAGRSTRIQHPTTKMLHEVGKMRILERTLHNLERAGLQNIYLVLGHQRDLIIKYLPEYRYVIQEDQLGTGHAVRCAKPICSAVNTMVVFGDKPLFRPQTLREFAETHTRSDSPITVSTVVHPAPEDYAEGYGTVVRYGGKVLALKKIEGTIECDGALYAFQTKWLWNTIDDIVPREDGQVFLPDIVEVATTRGLRVNEYRIKNYREATGINTPKQLREAARYLSRRLV